MKTIGRSVLLSVLLVVVGCSGGTPSEPRPAETTLVPTAAPALVPVEKSDAAKRADELLADITKREEAYKKAADEVADRDRLARMPTTTAATAPATKSAPPGPAPAPTPATQPLTSSGAPPVGDGRDESWWKSRMREAEVAFEDATTQLAAAEIAADQQRLQITYDKALAEVNARKATVANTRAAVDRVREDARRANVPPGWLRWP